jgi:hypothetical protein
VTPRKLTQRRRALFTMLTVLDLRYTESETPLEASVKS